MVSLKSTLTCPVYHEIENSSGIETINVTDGAPVLLKTQKNHGRQLADLLMHGLMLVVLVLQPLVGSQAPQP